jgi:hypothetical protein
MSKNIDQIYTANPITTNASTDLMYFGQSPYGVGDDAAMLYSSFKAQFPPLNGVVLLAPSGAQTITGFGLTVPSLTTANMSFDVTANAIKSTGTNANIIINPNGTGKTSIGNFASPITSAIGSLQVLSSSASTGGVLSGLFANNGNGGVLGLLKSRNTTPGSFTTLQNGDVVSTIKWYGDDGSAYTLCASIEVDVSGSPSTGVMPTQMTFNTTTTVGVSNTAMTISNAQVVTLANPLPAGSGGTGITSLGTGVATALGQNVTGSGGIVLANTPTLITPVIGAATGTSLTTTSNIQATAGALISGSTGSQGVMILVPTTASTGRFIALATPNSGNFDVRLTNAAFGQATTLTIPDPGASTATFTLLGNSSAGSGVVALETDGTWTPTITFATAGDLSVSYANQNGYYSRVGNTVTANFTLVFTPTFTTASGLFEIASFPVTSRSGTQNNAQGSLLTATMIFPTGTSSICLSMASASTVCSIYGSGSTVSGGFVSASSFVSGTQYVMQGTITYLV